MDPLEETKIISDHMYSSTHYDIEPAIYVSTEDEVNDICRICLQNNAIKNWEDEIEEFCGMSLREFYYKLTQLQMLDEDPHPKMLCQTCLTELKGAHFLMVKALESHAVLRGTDLDDSKPIFNENKINERNYDTKDQFNSKCSSEGLNTLIKQNEELVKAIEKLNKTLEKKGKESDYKSPKEIDYSTYILNKTQSPKISNPSSLQEEISSNSKKKKVFIDYDSVDSDYQEIHKLPKSEMYKFGKNKSALHKRKATHKEYEKVTDFDDNLSYEDDIKDFNNYIEETEYIDENESDNLDYINSNSKEASQKIIHERDSGNKEKFMCAYCPKLLSDKKSLERHEETHNKNRERKETCPHCSVKFYTTTDLRMHIQTHSLQREKKYKCEFCDKAYYERGGLNVHRRIHLGQMLPCSICPKEYYRQQDLDVHKVKAHGVTPIHGNVKLRTKYYIHCNDCNKTMRTTSWKEHQARHLKIPLLKCSLCDIDFRSRCACLWHMAKVHDYKKREEYEQHIVYLKDKRLSHKLLQQQKLLLLPDTPDTPDIS